MLHDQIVTAFACHGRRKWHDDGANIMANTGGVQSCSLEFFFGGDGSR